MRETKDFSFEAKEITDTGTVAGYASVFSVRDLDNDIIEPGAFRKTMQERKSIPILWQHNPYEPIGITREAKEDGEGLFVVGDLNLETQRGREAFSLLKQGALKGLSIGYEVIKHAWEGNVRRIKEIRLWEWSLVTFPANPLAQVLSVKGWIAVPYQDLPLADRDHPWDGDQARARLAIYAGGPDKDKIDWKKYEKGFLIYDKDNPENFGSYKLPIADVINGKLYVIPRGVFAAGAALMGARGGVDAPEEVKRQAMRNLEPYYERMGLTPPWKKSEELELALSYLEGVFAKQGEIYIPAESMPRAVSVAYKLLSLAESGKPSLDTYCEGKPDVLDEVLDNLRAIRL